MKIIQYKLLTVLALVALLPLAHAQQDEAKTSAAERLRPYILAEIRQQPMDEAERHVRNKLTAGGFRIVGQYAPYDEARILAITRDDLLDTAAQSDFGGFGAVIKVALTQAENGIQISYNNPAWVEHIYRLEAPLDTVSHDLAKLLGNEQAFGSKKGKTAKQLRKYRYMMMMPRFDDNVRLAKYKTYQQAVAAVEKGLESGLGNTRKVFRVDIPGKDETVFGVAITDGPSNDRKIMKEIDLNELKHTAHLPYEILVSGRKIYMLHGKFRIAQSFPDLGMGTFIRISSAPGDIQKHLEAVARANKKKKN